MVKKNIPSQSDALTSEIKNLIEESRRQVAASVNYAMTFLYWQVGRRINQEILGNRRAGYGEQIIRNLSAELVNDYGNSFSEKNLRRMIQFAALFQDEEIVVSLIRQLSWSHILAVIPIEDSLKRNFYIEMCKIEKWSVRVFRDRINSMLYERTAISKKPEKNILNELELMKTEQKMSPDIVFRDPYFLDFLGLSDTYSENDLESAILNELQKFIIEFGSDFAFLARQKRITIDNDDYYIDLLFYHRRLKCLVAIDLKIGKFKAAYKGQMELYMRWLEKYEMVEGENYPIGLILCADKNEEHIELLQLENSNIKVAQYLTQLPDIKFLEQKLHQSMVIARNKLAQKEIYNE
ncbi:MAG TPA: PDDEXK nuclease domain-containing protein [Spirochaetota bacterium]|nr:PDDEXK nuclease domain-containing protein [Spirochaetota bacterium]HQO24057.1 PDDEXK nuclease domain-containing protein [Spirochaetota bacterium]HQP50188.1 PDDEXK nuclease domain-containing protein [Spirochaetota bacterium]